MLRPRGAQHDRLLGRHPEKLAREAAGRGNTVKATVIGAIHPTVGKVGAGRENVEHGTRDVHLRRARLAAGHVELKAAGLDLGDLGAQFLNGARELVVGHLLVYRVG